MRVAVVGALVAMMGVARAGPDSVGVVHGYVVPTLMVGGIGGSSHHDAIVEHSSRGLIDMRVALGGMMRVAPAWRVRVGVAADFMFPVGYDDSSGGLYRRDRLAILGLEVEAERVLANGWFVGGRASGQRGDSTTGQWLTLGGRARNGRGFVGVDVILARQATDTETSTAYGLLVGAGLEGRAGRYVAAAELGVFAILTLIALEEGFVD